MMIYFDNKCSNWKSNESNLAYVVAQKKKFIDYVLRFGHGSIAMFKEMLGFGSEHISPYDKLIGWDAHSIKEFVNDPVAEFGDFVVITVTD